MKRIIMYFGSVVQIVNSNCTHMLNNFLFIFFKQVVKDTIPSGLRIALASHYLSRYKKIILWGSGTKRASVKFDSLYTDMEYVKIHRAPNHLETHDLKHYTEMLVREFIVTNINNLNNLYNT